MATAVQKPYKGMGMEGGVARWYEKTTRKGMKEFVALAERLKALRPEGGDMLEVAPGPGFLAVEMARGGRWRVTALDISKTFVELASKNAAAAGVTAEFQQGNASAMPFAADRFDLVVCRAAFKNFSEPERAVQEMQRVLRPGGKGVIIDLRRDAKMEDINRYALGLHLKPWDRWAMVLTFRFMLLKRAYTQQELKKMLDGAGFKQTRVDPTEVGMEGWFEK